METSASVVGPIVSWAVLIALTIWVFVDAKAIGDDHGRSPGLVYTKPAAWAAGVFLALIVVLPIYLVNRVRYKRLAATQRAEKLSQLPPDMDSAAYAPDVWPRRRKNPLYKSELSQRQTSLRPLCLAIVASASSTWPSGQWDKTL